MASPFQRQALHRKLIYAALILVLFLTAFVWRFKEFSVLGMEVKGVDAQARDLAIREQSRGEVDPVGALVRLASLGLRGVATCWEWTNAMDAQKKNQWNELEVHVRTLTKLQPHFITPWIFQSWNLSYNVSVESDRVADKFFYISRGIGLLAEGERQNLNNPDMRWSIGFFTQHKIGQSDETNTLRSLFQLSTIPPNDRDPGRFRVPSEGGAELNYKELEDFCKKHPQLVRRLREGMRRERKLDQMRQFRCDRATDFVEFLEVNARVPSRWVDRLPSQPGTWHKDSDKEKPLADRFPVLPPRHQARPHQQPVGDTLTSETELRDEDDAYQVARAWYSYAQEPLPRPGPLPGSSEPLENRVYQRLPRHMTTLIFRDYPAQAQRFTAERLLEEGWFDASGWVIPKWFPNDCFSSEGEAPAPISGWIIPEWFRSAFSVVPALIGNEHPWGLEAWRKTRTMWTDFGEANRLLLSPAEEERKRQQASEFAKKYNLRPQDQAPVLREDTLDAVTREQYFAHRFMRDYRYYRQISNFEYHYNRALVEAQDETMKVRKNFFEAIDLLRIHNDESGALKKLLDPKHGMTAWRDKVLMTNKVFRRDSLIQEQTFEIQLRYLDLSARLGGRRLKAQAAAVLLLPEQTPLGAGACPVGLTHWVPPLIAIGKGRNNVGWNNPLLGGPFDRVDEEGLPLIDQHARDRLLQRLFPALYAQNQPPGTKPPTPPQPPGQ